MVRNDYARTIKELSSLTVEQKSDLLFNLAQQHKPVPVHGPCGHKHTEEERENSEGKIVGLEWHGLVCEDGISSWVCELCGLDEHGEVCATTTNWPCFVAEELIRGVYYANKESH